MKTYSGSCLCKAVTFEIHGEFNGFYFCHCSRCRKVTGTAHGANLFSRTAELKWLTGTEKIKSYRYPNTRFAKSFCEICSSALPVSNENVRLVVPAGSLDCDVETKPSGHIFMGSRANWDHEIEKVVQFEELPSKV